MSDTLATPDQFGAFRRLVQQRNMSVPHFQAFFNGALFSGLLDVGIDERTVAALKHVFWLMKASRAPELSLLSPVTLPSSSQPLSVRLIDQRLFWEAYLLSSSIDPFFPLNLRSGARQPVIAMFQQGSIRISDIKLWAQLRGYDFGTVEDLIAVSNDPALDAVFNSPARTILALGTKSNKGPYFPFMRRRGSSEGLVSAIPVADCICSWCAILLVERPLSSTEVE